MKYVKIWLKKDVIYSQGKQKGEFFMKLFKPKKVTGSPDQINELRQAHKKQEGKKKSPAPQKENIPLKMNSIFKDK